MRLFTSLAAILLAGSTSALAAEIKAVASFSILGDMVKQVGGDRVEVTTIVGPNADTHVYQPSPADAVAVSATNVFFVSGLGFEGWMDRLVEATGYSGPLVVASEGVTTLTLDEDGETITDPHAWQSLTNGLIYVANIEAGLCEVDPAGCPDYTANAAAYSAEIASLDAEIKAAIAMVPVKRRKVITTHDAFGYFGSAYGVEFIAPEGVSTESEASAQDVARLIEQVRNDAVSALFIENMSDPRLLEQIASETGVKVRGALYADALTGTDEGGASYLDMFRHNVDLLVPAMEGK